MAIKNWEPKLTRALKILKGLTPFSDDLIKMAASSLYYKLMAGDKYVPSEQFKGNIALFKATDNFMDIDDDYGLTPVSFATTLII